MQLQLNGLNFHVRDSGSGEAVLLLHGFPDSGAVWRHQVTALEAAGYRVINPDLRGFGQSDKPPDTASYRIEHLLGDIIALLDALDLARVHVICHDWGASLGWMLGGLHSERVRSVAALSVGHPQSFYGAGLRQREKSWYMLLFQFEDVAERIMRADDWSFFREFTGNHAECARWLPALTQDGALRAALNWYRANAHPAQTFRSLKFPRLARPAFGLWGSTDRYLDETQMVGSAAYVDAHWQYARIEGAGHWLQLDRADEINRQLLAWLQGPARAA